MPRTKRPKAIYQRGEYSLLRREGRANLEVVWYDAARKRERSASAGTSCDREGRLALDRLYLAANGTRVCSECGRPMEADGSPFLSAAIADYLLTKEGTAGHSASSARLGHVLDYLATGDVTVTCAQIDERWVAAFRTWLTARPVPIGKTGTTRPRALGSVEGSVLQLAAAINATLGENARFTAVQMKAVARSPTYRADVATLAAMFRFCLYPDARSDKEQQLRVVERTNLLRYLRAAVATWARPEEIFDLGPSQWTKSAGVLDLNPPGRRQTRKHRGRIPIPRQFAVHLDALDGPYMPVAMVRASWDRMRAALRLPGDREAGVKLIRRSMATIVRRRIGEANWRQGEMMLGHVKSTISDIYAVPDPANLGLALAATEAVIDEIEAICPGAYRSITATGGTLRAVGAP